MESTATAGATIRLLAANCFAERVGGWGLTVDELEPLSRDLARVHADLSARRRAGTLPFYELPHDRAAVDVCRRLADRVRERADDLLVLGIGGSALGTTAVHRALSPALHGLVPRERRKGMRLFVCDNVDPETFGEVLETLDPARTAVNVISKSGGTAETLAQFLAVRRWLSDALGADEARRRLVVTTDPTKGFLRKLAASEGLDALEVPPGVGGRFSVFTPVGLFPLAAAGVDVEGLLEGAASMDGHLGAPDLWDNPAYLFAALHVLMLKKGRNVNVLMPYSDALRDVADWFRQIWAESLGKRRSLDGREVWVGPTPVKALGTTDQHSQVQLYMEGPQDKLITFIEVERPRRDVVLPAEFPGQPEVEYLQGKTLGGLLRAEKRGTEAALTRAGRPNLTLLLPEVSPRSVGQLLHLLQVATVCAGGLLGVNPLDQPGVELGKEFTFGLMGREGYDARAREVESAGPADPRFIVPRL